MSEIRHQSGMARHLVTAAAVVVVIAGLQAAQAIVVPFLLALFIALITSPVLLFLTRHRVPRGLAVTAVIVLILGVGTGVAALVGTSLNEFINALPRYQGLLQQRLSAAEGLLESYGVELPMDLVWTSILDADAIIQIVAAALGNASAMLANTFFILITAVFMLLEASSMPAKLAFLFSDPGRSMRKLRVMLENLNRYVAIKTVASIGTGLLVYLWLQLIGVDFALLWGLVAFLLNYVPNIGSIIAAIPAVTLALIQSGLPTAVVAGIGYLVVNFVIGTVIEPRYMGRGLGLSTLVVILSLVFWGWVLGPVGMLLSAPLTMMLKVGLETFDDTRWIAVLLGPEVAESEERG